MLVMVASFVCLFIFLKLFLLFFFFFFNDTATTEIYTLSLHDALPISPPPTKAEISTIDPGPPRPARTRSEEHTSELQSRRDLVCRLLLEKKKKKKNSTIKVKQTISSENI